MNETQRVFFKRCIVEFHDEFLRHFGVGDNEYTDKIIDNLTSDPNFIYIIKEDKGMIIGYVQPYVFNPNVRVSQEMGWYVLPEFRGHRVGLELIKEYEEVSKLMGADVIMMATLDANDISSYYEKKGYNAQEKFYFKEL